MALLLFWPPFTPVALLPSSCAPTTAVPLRHAQRNAEYVTRSGVGRFEVGLLGPVGPAAHKDVGCAGDSRALSLVWLPLIPVALLSSPGAPTTTVSPDIDRVTEVCRRSRHWRL